MQGKLFESVLKGCGQAVCRRKGRRTQWVSCPSPATMEDLQNVEKTLQEGHEKIKKDMKKELKKIKKELKDDLENRILEALEKVCGTEWGNNTTTPSTTTTPKTTTPTTTTPPATTAPGYGL